MLSAFTQSSIAQDEYLSAQDVLNICNQLSWRIIANNKIVDAKEGSWITDEYYSESIRNIIGKAIADCITGTNEFAGKTAEQTITFDVDHRKNKYTEANWNAVVLCNLIHICHCEYLVTGKCNMTQAFNEVEARIKQKYAEIEKIFTKIQNAIRDIKEYTKMLYLEEYFKKFCTVSSHLRISANEVPTTTVQIAPHMTLFQSKIDDGKYKYLYITNDIRINLKKWDVIYAVPAPDFVFVHDEGLKLFFSSKEWFKYQLGSRFVLKLQAVGAIVNREKVKKKTEPNLYSVARIF